MASDSLEALPFRYTVEEIISSRYSEVADQRPEDWDQRIPGKDVVRLKSGKTITLQSDGGQSPPAPGWVVLVTGGDAIHGYEWTLYGIPRKG
ncbi:MAG: hypothetical protein R3A13_07910 [Bdellovibrionota bacterium]